MRIRRIYHRVVQLLSHVRLVVTSWTAAHQAPLSFTVPWSLFTFLSIELVMLTISSSLSNFYLWPNRVNCVDHVVYYIRSTNLSYHWREWDDLGSELLKVRLVEFSTCKEDGIRGEGWPHPGPWGDSCSQGCWERPSSSSSMVLKVRDSLQVIVLILPQPFFSWVIS